MKKTRTLSLLTALVLLLSFTCFGVSAMAGTLTNEPATLTWFMPNNDSWARQILDLNETLFFQEMERITGVHIEWQMPPVGQHNEQFSLLINSGDLPDIITHETDMSYPGGGDKAIQDGAYLRLNELIEEHAPNYSALINSTPDFSSQSKTDEGNIWGFSMVEEKRQGAWLGMVVRQDWLDKLGMETPVTLDDWHEMLTRFKNELDAEAPMLMEVDGTWNCEEILSAFDVGSRFYQVDGVAKYGPIEPGYREYVELMRQWYAEGLIDQEFNTRSDASDLISNDEVGAYREGFYMLRARKQTAVAPDFRLVGVPTPVKAEGDVVHLRQSNNYVRGYETAITTACKNPELAVKYLDFIYSDEGYLLSNYGVEGVTYNFDENGEPQLSDLIVNNPDGKGVNDAIHYYLLHHGPMNRVWDRDAAGYTDDENACESIWNTADDTWVMPPITMNATEGTEFANIMADIDNLVNEMTVKFIMGMADMSEYDAFVDQIKAMRIDEALGYQQAALDRYLAR